jgi:hypothetical protein
VLVTGRQLPDLLQVSPPIELFDRAVLENGALLYSPSDRSEQLLADPPPQELVAELERRGVSPLAVGRVIVATDEPYADLVRKTIRELGLSLQLIFNKGAVMALPTGVDKGTGMSAALVELGILPAASVGIGDAENDLAFLALCGYAVAVGNALESVKQQADLVTAGAAGAGIVEVIDRLLGIP